MSRFEYRGKTALVTGASSGIGEAFSRRLAQECGHLILVARESKQIRDVAARLQRTGKARVTVMTADLSVPEAAAALKDSCDRQGYEVDVLVNNAGLGTFGAFHELPLAQEAHMVLLNARAVCDMAHAFLPGMLERGQGVLINTASSAAILPTPWFATYGASKAFVLSLSESLWALYRRKGVRVCAVCPGPVDTGFFAKTQSDIDSVGVFQRRITPERVVQQAMRGIDRCSPVMYCDWLTAIQAVLIRISPRSWVAASSEFFMRPPRSSQP